MTLLFVHNNTESLKIGLKLFDSFYKHLGLKVNADKFPESTDKLFFQFLLGLRKNEKSVAK